MIRIKTYKIIDGGLRYFNGELAHGIYLNKYNNLFWYRNGRIHRDGDKPAIVGSDGGYKAWYKNGLLHRDNDKPAIEYANGDRLWYQNGNVHRDGDQPAIICNGDKFWYRNDERYYPDEE